MIDTEFAAAARHLASRLYSLARFEAPGRPVWTGDDIDPTAGIDPTGGQERRPAGPGPRSARRRPADRPLGHSGGPRRCGPAARRQLGLVDAGPADDELGTGRPAPGGGRTRPGLAVRRARHGARGRTGGRAHRRPGSRFGRPGARRTGGPGPGRRPRPLPPVRGSAGRRGRSPRVGGGRGPSGADGGCAAVGGAAAGRADRRRGGAGGAWCALADGRLRAECGGPGARWIRCRAGPGGRGGGGRVARSRRTRRGSTALGGRSLPPGAWMDGPICGSRAGYLDSPGATERPASASRRRTGRAWRRRRSARRRTRGLGGPRPHTGRRAPPSTARCATVWPAWSNCIWPERRAGTPPSSSARRGWSPDTSAGQGQRSTRPGCAGCAVAVRRMFSSASPASRSP